MRPITVLATTTLLALGTMSPAGATYEGQEGRIAFGAFVATDRTQGDIWSVRPDGQALRQLTDAAGLDICPAYSADGKHIAFCSNRTGAYEIWVMDANGKDERQLTALGPRSLFPDFSPDGSTVAFSAPRGHRWGDGPLDGPDSGRHADPRHGHAGRRGEAPRVVAGREHPAVRRGHAANATGQLWTLDVATGVRTQLTFDPTFKDQTPDWSPDGQLIAYDADEDIWRMAADGPARSTSPRPRRSPSSGPPSPRTAPRSPSRARADRCPQASATSR